MRPISTIFAALTVTCAAVSSPAVAQQAAPALSLELNAAEPSDKGCRLTFVVKNETGKNLTSASFEMALFDQAGVVERLTVLSFKDLTSGKTKVSRFDLSGVDCTKLGRVLINETKECVADGAPVDACTSQLSTSTKTSIGFGI